MYYKAYELKKQKKFKNQKKLKIIFLLFNNNVTM